MSSVPITLAVPCCNGAAHLEPLLRSLLEQDPPAQRLLLVDDASEDGSVGLARDLAGSRLEIVECSSRGGLVANWNRAAELVTTPYFALAHQDDVYEPGFAREMVAALEDAPGAGMAHCRAVAIDDAGQPVASPAEGYKRGLWRAAAGGGRGGAFRALLRGNFVICPSVVYRTKAFRELGGFRAGLRFVPDWDLALRMLADGWDLAPVDRPLLRYRRHAGSASVSETRTLNRYTEELELSQRARSLGQAAGFLEPDAALSPALRHNVLFDAYRDLRRGAGEDAEAKLAFLEEHAPEHARHSSVKLFRRLARLGASGRGVMRMGLAAVLLASRLPRSQARDR